MGPMASAEPVRKPVPIHTHALDNLRYIRETMERAGSFTAVPGWGGVAMGFTALAAAAFAASGSAEGHWLRVWLAEGFVGAAIGGVSMWRKARRGQTPLLSAPARKLLLAYLPAIVVGAV